MEQFTDEAEPAMTAARHLVERIAERSNMARVYQAEQLEFIDALRLQFDADQGADWRDPDSLEWRDLRAEVAAVLQIHERSAQSMLELARSLVHVFPLTLAGFRQARFSERHARILVEQSGGLSESSLSEYEARLLPFAEQLVPSRFEKLARQVHAELEPEALIERHRAALNDRRVALEPAGDGMTWYGAYLSAEDGVGASAVVTGIAKSLLTEGEQRTLAQIEADVFRDLLLDSVGVTAPQSPGAAPTPSPAASRGVRPEVLVHVPVLTAMGAGDAPGTLEGYGPIDAETARRLAGSAPGWLRILTDPDDGAIVSFGRTTYRVPGQLRRYLEARDEVCRFVGCTRAAKRCEIDHTIPWSEDGETVLANLSHLCKGHHRLKERRRWRIDNDGTGDITWTSPTGRVYSTSPARRFAPPGPPARRPAGAPPIVMNEWLAEDHSEEAPF